MTLTSELNLTREQKLYASKMHAQPTIKTLANLSTRKRTLMALWNPNEIHKVTGLCMCMYSAFLSYTLA